MIYRFPGSFPNASFMCIFCLAARLAPQTRKPTPQPRPWTCLCFTALSPPSPPWLSPSLKQRTVQKALSSLTSWQRVREEREGLKGSKAEAILKTPAVKPPKMKLLVVYSQAVLTDEFITSAYYFSLPDCTRRGCCSCFSCCWNQLFFVSISFLTEQRQLAERTGKTLVFFFILPHTVA